MPLEYDEVKAGLDNVAKEIVKARSQLESGRAAIQRSQSSLSGLPAQYGELVSAINGYAIDTTDPAELHAKAELAKLVASFTSLRAQAEQDLNALGIPF